MQTLLGMGVHPSLNGLRTPQITRITNLLVLLFIHDNDLFTRKTYTALSTQSTLRGGLLDGLSRLDIYFLHSYMSEPSERALRCELLFSKYMPLIAYHFVLFCERYFSNSIRPIQVRLVVLSECSTYVNRVAVCAIYRYICSTAQYLSLLLCIR